MRSLSVFGPNVFWSVFWRGLRTVCLAMVCLLSVKAAQAAVQIDIDLTRQQMNVVSNSGTFTWPVSTARSGYVTPVGRYSPYSLQKMHFSRKYHMSPMPHSIFFAGGYAIHGTYSVAQLGRPASHGCIRLSPGNAAKLFSMVKTEGASISISGEPPRAHYAKAKKKSEHGYAKAERRHRHYAAHGGYRTHGYYYYGAPVYADGGLAYAPMHAAPDVRGWQHNPYEHGTYYRW